MLTGGHTLAGLAHGDDMQPSGSRWAKRDDTPKLTLAVYLPAYLRAIALGLRGTTPEDVTERRRGVRR